MGKSILVIETPEYCAECSYSDDCAEACRLFDRLVTEVNRECEKHDWCPLKDVPEKNLIKQWGNGLNLITDLTPVLTKFWRWRNDEE